MTHYDFLLRSVAIHTPHSAHAAGWRLVNRWPSSADCTSPPASWRQNLKLFFVNLINVQNHVTLKWGRAFKVISPNSHLEQKHSHCPRPTLEALPCSVPRGLLQGWALPGSNRKGRGSNWGWIPWTVCTQWLGYMAQWLCREIWFSPFHRDSWGPGMKRAALYFTALSERAEVKPMIDRHQIHALYHIAWMRKYKIKICLLYQCPPLAPLRLMSLIFIICKLYVRPTSCMETHPSLHLQCLLDQTQRFRFPYCPPVSTPSLYLCSHWAILRLALSVIH